MEVKKIAIIVETEDGSAHQVIASHELKMMALKLLEGENGRVTTKAIEPIVFAFQN